MLADRCESLGREPLATGDVGRHTLKRRLRATMHRPLTERGGLAPGRLKRRAAGEQGAPRSRGALLAHPGHPGEGRGGRPGHVFQAAQERLSGGTFPEDGDAGCKDQVALPVGRDGARGIPRLWKRPRAQGRKASNRCLPRQSRRTPRLGALGSVRVRRILSVASRESLPPSQERKPCGVRSIRRPPPCPAPLWCVRHRGLEYGHQTPRPTACIPSEEHAVPMPSVARRPPCTQSTNLWGSTDQGGQSTSPRSVPSTMAPPGSEHAVAMERRRPPSPGLCPPGCAGPIACYSALGRGADSHRIRGGQSW